MWKYASNISSLNKQIIGVDIRERTKGDDIVSVDFGRGPMWLVTANVQY